MFKGHFLGMIVKIRGYQLLLFLEIFREVFRFLGKFKSLKVFRKRKIVLEDCYDVLYEGSWDARRICRL